MSVADPKCFVRLKQAIPGIDHIKFVDHRLFARAHHLIDKVASQLGVDKVNDFYVYAGEYGTGPVRWQPASKGLVAVRAVKEYIACHEQLGVAAEYRLEVLDVLAKLEELLDKAECRDIGFCFVGNY